MESKKINQLATELAPDLSDLTIIGDPSTGISKKITLSQMASLFTGTVEEYATLAAFPLVGVADTIYIALDTNIIYRYDTSLSAYVILSPNIINSLVFSDANGFDGTITLVGSVATLSITTALTLGSVPFIGASGALTQDNSNLFFDDTNNRLGIATALPTTPLDVFGSGIIGRLNATSTNNAYLGFASNGTNKWSAGNVQSDHRFRIFSEANSAELITILQTGEFGIGIANPLTKLHIDGGATALIANLDANVSVAKSISFRSDNSNRINLEVSGTESGSNAGADFFIRRYSDAGSLIDTPLTITRSTGGATFSSTLGVTGALSGTSATFSGNLTIDTDTLFVDSTNNRVGIGTITPDRLLTVYGNTSTTTPIHKIQNAGTGDAVTEYRVTGSSWNVGIDNSDGDKFKIGQDALGVTDRFVIVDGGNVGIGTSSPNNLLELSSATSGGSLRFSNSNNTAFYWDIGRESVSTGDFLIRKASGGAASDFFRITNDGNVGIAVTPAAWGTSSIKALQIGTFGSLAWIGGVDINIFNNAYYDGTNFKYIASQEAARYLINRNNHQWYIASAGSAGNNITFTEAMRITSGGYFKTSNNGNYFSSGSLLCSEFDNNTTDTPALFLSQTNTSFVDNVLFLEAYRTTTNNSFYMISAYNRIAGLYKFRVADSGNVTNTNNSYGALSDIKLKENIIDATPKLDNLLKVKIRNFNYIGNEEKQLGVVAQELEEIFPAMIEQHEDFEEVEIIDEEGNIKNEKKSLGTYTKSVKYSVFVPMLIKAMQEQQAQIEELKALINK